MQLGQNKTGGKENYFVCNWKRLTAKVYEQKKSRFFYFTSELPWLIPTYFPIYTFCIQIVCTMPVSLTKTKETQFTFKSDTSSTYLFSDEAQVEKSTPKRQHSAPEYLERRKQEKIRRKSELCLLKNRFQPRVLRKSDVGTTAKSQQEIRRSILMQENKNEEDKAQNVRLFSCSVMPAFTREKF